MSKYGLILEGGGMRGIYTAGVLDSFMLHNITVDGVIGVSAGACHGISYISHQIGRNYRINTTYNNSKEYMSIHNLLKTGNFFGPEMIYHKIPEELDPFDYETFSNSPMEFQVVVTNAETGEPEYLPLTDARSQIDYMQATTAIPLLARMVELDGKLYVDGGVGDSIPIQHFLDIGYDRNIVILTQTKGYRKQKLKLMRLLRQRFRNYPKLADAMERRYIRYNQSLDLVYQLEAEGKAVVIQPKSPPQVSSLAKNTERLTELYLKGVTDGEEASEKIQTWMAEG